MKSFFSDLSSCSSKPAILSIVEPLSFKYISKSLDENFPLCMSELFRTEYLQSNYGELLKLAGECAISITVEKAKLVESNCQSHPYGLKCELAESLLHALKVLLTLTVLHHLSV